MLYNLFHDIYFVKDCEDYSLHFNWLFRAISLVEKKYINYTVHNGSENNNERQSHKERVFAYELYRQWANILEKECNKEVVINAELDKIIEEKIETQENSAGIECVEIRKYPDLVLHHGQGDDLNQMIVCEVKRNSETKVSGSQIMADLYKLVCYMDENKFLKGKKPFEYGVFILLNGELDQIKSVKKSKIKVQSVDYTFQDFKREMYNHFENVICVSYNGNRCEYKTLKSLCR